MTVAPVRVGEVFVPGGLPTVTYNPRSELKLEERLQDYLEERHRIPLSPDPRNRGRRYC